MNSLLQVTIFELSSLLVPLIVVTLLMEGGLMRMLRVTKGIGEDCKIVPISSDIPTVEHPSYILRISHPVNTYLPTVEALGRGWPHVEKRSRARDLRHHQSDALYRGHMSLRSRPKRATGWIVTLQGSGSCLASGGAHSQAHAPEQMTVSVRWGYL